jgi:site-specific DNA-cytosine methylase
MKPLCIDLFCGYGGWARGFLDAGYRVIGFDIEPTCAARYPGEFHLQDVSQLNGADLQGARVIVASPPCTWFSLARAAGRDVGRGMVLVRKAKRVIDQANPDFWIIENVRGAYRAITSELGPPIHRGVHNQAHWLWGKMPGTILPRVPKMNLGRGRKATRAWEHSIIPYPLARAVADACLP